MVKRGWRYLNMPAICESADDPLGREIGQALWETQRPLSMLLDRRQANEYVFASLYQGRPRPRGDAVFNDPTFYSELPKQFRRGYGIDLAYTAKTHADWSVLVVLAAGNDGLVYVVDVIRRQCKAPEFRSVVKQALGKYGPGPVRWYCSGTEKGVADLLEIPSLQALAATTDKLVRAQRTSEAWNSGKLLVPDDPKRHPWLNDFLETVTNFTGVADAHDDDVDALAAGFDALQTAGYSGMVVVPMRGRIAGMDDDEW